MAEEISEQAGMKIITQQGIVAALGAATLISANPAWGALLVGVSLIVGVSGEFGIARTKELVEDLADNNDEFVKEIIDSERFKSVFINVVERQIKEVSEEKRKLFRQYLINLGKGLEPDFNMDSKLLSVLDQITPEELKVLDIWNGKLQRKLIERNQNIGYTMENIDEKMEESGESEQQIMPTFEGDDWPSMKELTFILRSLGGYGLLDVMSTSGVIQGDGSDGIRVKRITPFGKTFLGYIAD